MKKLRRQNNLSLFKVSMATGITDRYLQRIETGKHKNPGLDILTKLADFYGISLDTLVGRGKSLKSCKEQCKRDFVMLPLKEETIKKSRHN